MGVLSLVLSLAVVVFPVLALASLTVLLAYGLIFLGVRSISIAAHKALGRGVRVLGVVSGIMSLILALLVLVLPGYALLTLIWLLSFGLLLYGAWMIAVAFMRKQTSGGIKALGIVIGILDIILSVIVLALPGLALATLVLLLGVALFFSGIEMIVSGAIGRTWLGEMMESVKKDTTPPPATKT
jgi:hypothetical protein